MGWIEVIWQAVRSAFSKLGENVGDRIFRSLTLSGFGSATYQANTREGQIGILEIAQGALVYKQVIDAAVAGLPYVLSAAIAASSLAAISLRVSPPVFLVRESTAARARVALLGLIGLAAAASAFAVCLYGNGIGWANLFDPASGGDVRRGLLVTGPLLLAAYALAFGALYYALAPTAVRVAGAPWPYRSLCRALSSATT